MVVVVILIKKEKEKRKRGKEEGEVEVENKKVIPKSIIGKRVLVHVHDSKQ